MAGRTPSAPPILPGLSYVRPLGSGGFADVFLYQQDMPRRSVAVKVLPSDIRSPDLLRMFNSEADILAHLSAHPSIVTVYQAGVSADGRPYIVMEFCPDSLARRYRVERLPVEEVMATAVKMASALESAHRAGLIHRDVKPSNILVTTYGAAVLADFGISSSLSRRTADEPLAMSIPWSAPEVYCGEDRRNDRERDLEPRSDDLFALGRSQPVRTARTRPEQPGSHQAPHRSRQFRGDRPR